MFQTPRLDRRSLACIRDSHTWQARGGGEHRVVKQEDVAVEAVRAPGIGVFYVVELQTHVVQNQAKIQPYLLRVVALGQAYELRRQVDQTSVVIHAHWSANSPPGVLPSSSPASVPPMSRFFARSPGSTGMSGIKTLTPGLGALIRCA